MTMPPLFVLAPPRSFTSLTCAMLGSHPQAFGLAEINLFVGDRLADLEKHYEVRQRAANGLLRSLSELAFAEQTEETVDTVRRWLLDNADMTTTELFRTMQEWVGDKVLIDKSPLHVFMPQALRRIAEHLPEARYLHLTRHPGDTLKSLFQIQETMRETLREKLGNRPARRFKRDEADAPDKYWLQPHLQILEFLESVPVERQMRIRGEELLSDPPTYLRQVAEWLDLRSDSEAVEAMMHPENSPFAKYGPANARYGNDPNFMENPQLRPYSYTPRPLNWSTPEGKTQDFGREVRAYAMIFGY
jgi:hypothetical protein